MTEGSAISLKNIKKCFGEKEVLSGVDLDIPRGTVFGLVGRNGAGKTTIFRILLGLTEATDGTVRINDGSLEEGRKKTGFLLGNHFFPYMTGKENLEYRCRLKGVTDKGVPGRLLELVGLSGVKTKAGKYSLGMKQRLGIAMALVGDPEILILDEPTNGLDPQGIADIRHLIRRLNSELGLTVIVSSHILGELQHTADIFGIVNEGRIVRILTAEDLESAGNTVRLSVDDLARAKEILLREGIRIEAETRDSVSLEDFYFNVVEGGRS